MSVAQALGTYPYLFADVLWLSGPLLVVRSLPVASHRRLILRLGLVMIPNFLFSLAHGDYWNPIRLGGWVLGPEDVLFAFNVAAMGCLPAVLLYRHRLIVAEQAVPRIGRILAVGIPAQCAFLVLRSMGRSSMASAILALLMAIMLLLLLRPDLRRFSVAGGIGFSLIYCGIVKTVFWIWPDFVSCLKSTLRGGCSCSESPWARSPGPSASDSSGRSSRALCSTSASPRLGACGAPLFRRQNLVDLGDDLRRAEGFLQERHAWTQNARLHIRIRRVAGDEQDAKAFPARCQARSQFPAGHPGHHHVGDEQIDGAHLGIRQGQRLRTAAGLDDAVAGRPQNARHQTADSLLILHQQNGALPGSGPFHGRGGGSLPGFGVQAGQIHREGRPFAGPAADRDRSPTLLDDPVDRRQAETGSLARPPWW